MPAHFENAEKSDGSKIELAFSRDWQNLKTVGNLTVKNSLQDFDVKEMYLHPSNQLQGVSKNCSTFDKILKNKDNMKRLMER